MAKTPRMAAVAELRPSSPIDPSRRVIDMTAAELVELVDSRLELFVERTPTSDDGALDRAGAAAFLRISLAQLDKLAREQGLPFHRCGDVRRFLRVELLEWLKAGDSG